jgi:hypothetical protein
MRAVRPSTQLNSRDFKGNMETVSLRRSRYSPAFIAYLSTGDDTANAHVICHEGKFRYSARVNEPLLFLVASIRSSKIRGEWYFAARCKGVQELLALKAGAAGFAPRASRTLTASTLPAEIAKARGVPVSCNGH